MIAETCTDVSILSHRGMKADLKVRPCDTPRELDHAVCGDVEYVRHVRRGDFMRGKHNEQGVACVCRDHRSGRIGCRVAKGPDRIDKCEATVHAYVVFANAGVRLAR